MAISLESRIELHELAARFGDLVDARDWPGLATVFTEDAVFDTTASEGGVVMQGLAGIQQYMEVTTEHPMAHLIVNIYVTESGEAVQLHSRVIGILRDRRVGSGRYVDDVVRTPEGWRIRNRQFTLLRRHQPDPAPS